MSYDEIFYAVALGFTLGAACGILKKYFKRR